jgi:hypothetical protein
MPTSFIRAVALRAARQRQRIGSVSPHDHLLPAVPSLAGYVVKVLSTEEALQVLRRIQGTSPSIN